MIDQIYLMLYNLLFTSLPPLAIGVYDKVVSEDLLLATPYLYRYVSTYDSTWHSASVLPLPLILFIYHAIVQSFLNVTFLGTSGTRL